MISMIYSDKRKANDGTFLTEYDGLSTDIKPLKADGARNADMFYEMNTGVLFKFDEENNKWIEQ